MRVWLSLLVVSNLLHVASAADWPQFRGPNGLGASAEPGLPDQWNSQQNVAWKVPLPGFGSSSPIVLGDRIYVTSYSGFGLNPEEPGDMDDLRLHVSCLELASGNLIWDRVFEPTLPESERVRDHGYAAATPATDGDRLYVFFGKSGVLALELDGTQVWRTHVGSGTHSWGCGTSPVLHDDLVIVNASVESGALVAIHKRTGEIAWRADGMDASWNTPAACSSVSS